MGLQRKHSFRYISRISRFQKINIFPSPRRTINSELLSFATTCSVMSIRLSLICSTANSQRQMTAHESCAERVDKTLTIKWPKTEQFQSTRVGRLTEQWELQLSCQISSFNSRALPFSFDQGFRTTEIQYYIQNAYPDLYTYIIGKKMSPHNRRFIRAFCLISYTKTNFFFDFTQNIHKNFVDSRLHSCLDSIWRI